MTNKDFLKEVGNKVRIVRAIRGLTIKQLSDVTGINDQTINSIELGKGATDITTLKRIADALKVEVTALLTFTPLI